MKAQKLNQRQARWSLYLSRFDFALKYVAGKSMGRADSLSRRVDWAEGVKRDNENQVMLKKEWLEVRAMEQLVEGPGEEIVKKIKKARDKDEEVIKVVEEMKKAGVKMFVMILFLRVGSKNNSCIRETQENSIEFLVQSSLPYILLLMVCAHCCAPYPNDHVYNMRPTYVIHVV